ncbi:helix-turn-helix transcriptional regulator [Actinophytocola sp.]|uniref:helix-turn-helix domain-containing protein n=1 Tax=Actinophytocola sp. TaxID=1872138 RepID=UPI002D3116C4|nr:helix-turn-helix transcriptional regulator [Actinophytocola sp.]HYQ62696.1 helix-turn-helix transcriptional regulator [Actinophytocola sp.]
MPDDAKRALGHLIRELREGLGHSQGQLADLLCKISGCDTVTREIISRWERGKRSPNTYWLPHVATALQVPTHTLEAEEVKRRQFFRLTALAAGTTMLDIPDTATELVASIASGDPGPLTDVQTTHRTDLAVSRLATTDRASLMRLSRWMADGDTAVLRVNAAGILAKTTSQVDVLDEVAVTLARDEQARIRYVQALTGRVGDTVQALAAEVLNPRDAGARWCAARLLGQDGSPAARQALTTALRRDPVRENVRTFGLILSGANPCT